MTALINPKHELFAQALARGQSQEKAYVEAGYAPASARQGACRLLQRRDDISQRVGELVRQRLEADAQAVTDATAALALDKQWVLSRLMAVYEAGVRKKREGTSENLGAAIRALELMGKTLGMFVDRREVEHGSIEDWLRRYCYDDKGEAVPATQQAN